MTQLGRGGAENQTVELLRGLSGNAWAPTLVVVLSDDIDPYGKSILDLGYRLEVIRRGRSYDASRLVALRRLIARENIDVIHAVHMLASGYAFLASRGMRRPKVLPTIRGTVVEPGPFRSIIYRWMFHACPRALANSHRGAAFVATKFRVPDGRIRVVPNGIDFRGLRERRAETAYRSMLGIPEDAPVVAYVGKNSRVKNVPRFLAMWESVSATLPRAHAVLVGGGLGDEGRATLLGGCPADRTHFLGPRDDVPALLSQADVLALTSNSEGAPNVVLEALALGTPVVSTDVGDVKRMVVHGRTGFVEEGGSAEALASAVRRILSDRHRFREAVSGDAERLEREYSIDAMTSGTVALWQEIVGHATRR